VRSALQVLIEFNLAANRDQEGKPKHLEDQDDDGDGLATNETLSRTLALASRITGNDKGSLGLHPAIYFYGPTARHSIPMFLGMSIWIGRKMVNNDKLFFEKFTTVRSRLETILIEHKDLIATILQKTISRYRVNKYAELLETLVSLLHNNPSVVFTDAEIVVHAGLTGKIITGIASEPGEKFSEDTKSAVFIKTALKSALRCPICKGYLDPAKSVSYDHVTEKAVGGKGNEENCQLTHPYCNQAVKNKIFQDGLH
jgi:hypothetical protein